MDDNRFIIKSGNKQLLSLQDSAFGGMSHGREFAEVFLDLFKQGCNNMLSKSLNITSPSMVRSMSVVGLGAEEGCGRGHMSCSMLLVRVLEACKCDGHLSFPSATGT